MAVIEDKGCDVAAMPLVVKTVERPGWSSGRMGYPLSPGREIVFV
jgi:hypothetical protein